MDAEENISAQSAAQSAQTRFSRAHVHARRTTDHQAPTRKAARAAFRLNPHDLLSPFRAARVFSHEPLRKCGGFVFSGSRSSARPLNGAAYWRRSLWQRGLIGANPGAGASSWTRSLSKEEESKRRRLGNNGTSQQYWHRAKRGRRTPSISSSSQMTSHCVDAASSRLSVLVTPLPATASGGVCVNRCERIIPTSGRAWISSS